jgi:hypothetical protein
MQPLLERTLHLQALAAFAGVMAAIANGVMTAAINIKCRNRIFPLLLLHNQFTGAAANR